MRRVGFVARGMWGLELGSRVAGDVEIGGREVVEWDCGRGNTVDGCACEMLGVGLEGGGRKVVAGRIGVNIASCTDHVLATSSPSSWLYFSSSPTLISTNNCVANTLLILV